MSCVYVGDWDLAVSYAKYQGKYIIELDFNAKSQFKTRSCETAAVCVQTLPEHHVFGPPVSGEKLQLREFGRTTAHLGMQAAALTAIQLNKNYMTACPEGFRPQISFISVFSQVSGKETFKKNAAE